MPDDPEKRRPQDANRINIHEEWEVRYWSKKFGVSHEELKELVHRYGSSVEKIRANLRH